jgi:phosphonate utilization associated putative membrane protein
VPLPAAGLSAGIAAAVLGGALLHAGWNVLVKSSRDKALDTALIHLLGSLIGLPLIAVFGLPPLAVWPWLLASVVIHIGYHAAVAAAYEHGDLGLAYPLMRGAAPLLVALASAITVGEQLGPLAWVGVLGVCAGVLLLGLSRHALERPQAVAIALGNAVLIAVYTVVDALGARTAVQDGGVAMQYVALLFAINGWPFGLLVLRRRGWAQATAYARERWPVALGGAAASLGSYAIALWAMTRAPVAMVAALRETSVLFALLLGGWLLRERGGWRRAAGGVAIVGGVVALRLG